jgi:hypothetical protein
MLCLQNDGLDDDVVPVREDGPAADWQAEVSSALPLHHLPEADGIRCAGAVGWTVQVLAVSLQQCDGLKTHPMCKPYATGQYIQYRSSRVIQILHTMPHTPRSRSGHLYLDMQELHTERALSLLIFNTSSRTVGLRLAGQGSQGAGLVSEVQVVRSADTPPMQHLRLPYVWRARWRHA